MKLLDSVFIVRKESNDLIFYGQLVDQPTEDLETVLGQIIMKANGKPKGTRKLIALKQGKFLYAVDDNFYMILALAKGTSKDIADKILQKLASEFRKKYDTNVISYSGDNTVFNDFSSDIQTVLTQPAKSEIQRPNIPSMDSFQENQKVEKIESTKFKKNIIEESKNQEIPKDLIENEIQSGNDPENESKEPIIPLSQRKGMIELNTKQVVQDTFSLDKPLIKPQKRQAYPEGIPEYARDEILFNESFDVQKNFECELINYSVSVVKITLNISLTHIYNIEIDFSDYPNIPKINLGESLKNELKKPMEEISYFLKNWDPKIPPHITEIVYEIEKILTRFKSKGILSPTQEIPDYILPELKPLEGDIKYDPNYKNVENIPPEYDGSELTEKFEVDSRNSQQSTMISENQSQGRTPSQISNMPSNGGKNAQFAGNPNKNGSIPQKATKQQLKQLKEKQKQLEREEKLRKKMEAKHAKEQQKRQKT